MPSFQNSAGPGKAAKFVAANPLAPMADPFGDQDDDTTSYQKALSENVNERLMKGLNEIKQRHADGTYERDEEGMGPTGPTYRARERKERHQRAALAAAKEKENQNNRERLEILRQQHRELCAAQNNEDADSGDDSSDGEFDHLLDEVEEDPKIKEIRNKRLEAMRQKQAQRAEWLAKGHGQYRLITQDEFLPECTGSSRWVVVHFAHDEFERCKIMDHHLRIIATQHLECKFLKILAPKAPFFVSKLSVKTLPSVLIFRDGKAVDRLTGFEGLAPDPTKPDEWETSRLQLWLSEMRGEEGAIQFVPPSNEVLKEMERLGLQYRGSIYSDENPYDQDDS